MSVGKLAALLLWGFIAGFIVVNITNNFIFQSYVPSVDVPVQNVISFDLTGAIIPLLASCLMAFYLLHSQGFSKKKFLLTLVFLLWICLSLSKVEKGAIVLTFPLLGLAVLGYIPAVLSLLLVTYRREKNEIELTRKNYFNSLFLSYSCASLAVLLSDLLFFVFLSTSLYWFRVGGAGLSDAIFLVGPNSIIYLTTMSISIKMVSIADRLSEEDKRSLALVLAGALLGSVPSVLVLSLTPAIVVSSAIVLGTIGSILLLYGIGILQNIYRNHVLHHRWKAPLRIGILYDMKWDLNNPEIFAWSDVSPDDWKIRLEKFAKSRGVEVRIEFINVREQFHYFATILNPYGGVYPEVNLKTLATLDKILGYVREGGMFVNVADIPSYWAYNPDLHRKLDITAVVYATFPTATGIQVISTKPFELTPLVKALGLRIAGINPGFPQNLNQILGPSIHVSVTSRRAAIVESNVDSCIPPARLRYIDGNVYDMSALFFVKYGEGDFLLSLI